MFARVLKRLTPFTSLAVAAGRIETRTNIGKAKSCRAKEVLVNEGPSKKHVKPSPKPPELWRCAHVVYSGFPKIHDDKKGLAA